MLPSHETVTGLSCTGLSRMCTNVCTYLLSSPRQENRKLTQGAFRSGDWKLLVNVWCSGYYSHDAEVIAVRERELQDGTIEIFVFCVYSQPPRPQHRGGRQRDDAFHARVLCTVLPLVLTCCCVVLCGWPSQPSLTAPDMRVLGPTPSLESSPLS